MPFFKPANSQYYVDCGFLQVPKSIEDMHFSIYRKRAYLFTSQGSVSIEATIAISIFMMITLFIGSYMQIINTEYGMQIKINNAVREVSNNMFYAEALDQITDNVEELDKIKEDISFIESDIKEGYLKSLLFSEIDSEEYKYFLCGIAGINTTESSIEDGIVDLVATYKMEVPFVKQYITITQRARMKGWNGVDITQEQDMVYITETGEVYHTTKDCSHLSINIRKTTRKLATNEGYSKCYICVNRLLDDDDSVFVTEDGEKYHSNLKCSGLTRKIITISKKEVEDMPICSRCEREKNDN